MPMKVLVIIPAYNEEEAIRSVVEELRAKAPACDYVVVNDCSTDGTRRVLRENGFRYIDVPVNLGIGGGVQTGYRYAAERGYDVTVQLDGDGQHDPAYIEAIVGPVARGECDMCVGSRFIKKEGFQTSFMRRFGIRFLKWLIFINCGARVSDTTSGFRACSKELTAFFARHYAQDYPEPEAILSAVLAGFTVAEAPVVMRERAGGSSSIKPWHSAYFMFKVSLAIILGRFKTKREKRG
ncbi:MAG: glycosyltransferase family 2 protein [Oscillospiraceae bacterium]|nr:glycosyltransferase family 2 protein [Oscillospiraceae bacterium]